MFLPISFLKKIGRLTTCEMDLLLFALERSDQFYCPGIKATEVVEATGMNRQSFYNSVKSLAKKQIIYYPESNRPHQDYDITIFCDRLETPEARSEGYVNLSRKIYQNEKFKNLSGKAKWLVFYFSYFCSKKGSNLRKIKDFSF